MSGHRSATPGVLRPASAAAAAMSRYAPRALLPGMAAIDSFSKGTQSHTEV